MFNKYNEIIYIKFSLLFLRKTIIMSFLFYFRCRASADCLGFLVNYDRESCSRLDSNSDESRQDIVSTPNKINYFEKVCLRGITLNTIVIKCHIIFNPIA